MPGGTQVHAPYTKKGKAARAAQISLLLRPALGSLAPTEAAVQPYPLGGCNPACNQTATLRSAKAATLRAPKLQPYVASGCNPTWPQAATLRAQVHPASVNSALNGEEWHSPYAAYP